MRVKLYSYNDGSYNFTVHLPQTSWFIKKSCKLELGAAQPGHEQVGMVHVKQVRRTRARTRTRAAATARREWRLQ